MFLATARGAQQGRVHQKVHQRYDENTSNNVHLLIKKRFSISIKHFVNTYGDALRAI